jgi:hypothetical protein
MIPVCHDQEDEGPPPSPARPDTKLTKDLPGFDEPP